LTMHDIGIQGGKDAKRMGLLVP